jgi:hypothetical protein
VSDPERLAPERRTARRRERKRRLRRRRIVALSLVLGAAALAGGLAFGASDGSKSSAGSTTPTVTRRCHPGKPTTKSVAPAWLTARRATVLVDSVLKGGISALEGNFLRWQIDVRGHEAIMLPAMEEELRSSGRRVAPLVVIGVGHNSLWERNRRNFGIWSARFDGEATRLIATLKRLGAQELIWVTLREATRTVIPSSALWQYDKYSWYFPYVNERLGLLAGKRDDLALANWAAVSNRPSITYDAFHLNPDGAALMARTIRAAVEAEGRAERRVVVIRPAKPVCKLAKAA